MKCFFEKFKNFLKNSVTLTICISSFLASTQPVAAQNRQEFYTRLSSSLQITADKTEIFKMSDWSAISSSSRAAIASAIGNGFLKTDDAFRPDWEVSSDETNNVIDKLDAFLITSQNYSKKLGEITSMKDDIITLSGNIQIPMSTAFLNKQENEIANSQRLSIGEKLCVALKDSKPVLVWNQKNDKNTKDIKSYEVLELRKGSLYLSDTPRFSLIIKSPKSYANNTWSASENKYDNLPLHSNAKIYESHTQISSESLNNSLDRNVSYLVGSNPNDNQGLRILHVEFNYNE